MKVQNSTIDSDYKLTTYDNGVQHIVYNSASWLVGCDHDKTGLALKAKFFPEPQIPAGYNRYEVRINAYGIRLGMDADLKLRVIAKSSTQARREAAHCGMNISYTTVKKIA